jgi:hypothetical protein
MALLHRPSRPEELDDDDDGAACEEADDEVSRNHQPLI